MGSINRPDRVGDLIMREIAQMIVNGEIKDPRVSSVVITDVKVTKDLGMARVFFTVMDEDKVGCDEALAGLRSATKFINGQLWKKFKMKRIPDIRFEIDKVLERGYRIDELLRSVKSEESQGDS